MRREGDAALQMMTMRHVSRDVQLHGGSGVLDIIGDFGLTSTMRESLASMRYADGAEDSQELVN